MMTEKLEKWVKTRAKTAVFRAYVSANVSAKQNGRLSTPVSPLFINQEEGFGSSERTVVYQPIIISSQV